jgi:pilus assembly protein Flp/PilA
MRKIISSYMNDESGAAAAEYALILAIVTSGIALAVTGLGEAISTAMGNAALWVTIDAP